MIFLASQGTVITTSVVVFLLVILLLVSILLWVKQKLTPAGTVTIDINEGEKALEVAPGQTLLSALGSNKIFLLLHVEVVVLVLCAVVRLMKGLVLFCPLKLVILLVRASQ